MRDKIELHINEFDFAENNWEVGVVITVKCPECGQDVSIASGAWWSQECACPRKWTVIARGEKR